MIMYILKKEKTTKRRREVLVSQCSSSPEMEVSYFIKPVSLPPNIFKSSPEFSGLKKKIERERRKAVFSGGCSINGRERGFGGMCFGVQNTIDVSHRFSP